MTQLNFLRYSST
uniref:Uncharacterized protein n=1 Tax=Arundo donax TaxID=35708 RepID=A0A0A9EEG5_ARUDO